MRQINQHPLLSFITLAKLKQVKCCLLWKEEILSVGVSGLDKKIKIIAVAIYPNLGLIITRFLEMS